MPQVGKSTSGTCIVFFADLGYTLADQYTVDPALAICRNCGTHRGFLIMLFVLNSVPCTEKTTMLVLRVL